MIQIFIVALSLSGFLPLTTPHVFSESTLDMLTQCNRYQTEMFADNRTTHSCETENYSESFSYVIEKLQTRYSKQHFWCFLFLKDEYFKLKFKLWFSHKDFIVDANGIKFNKPSGDKWESRALFKLSLAIVVPKANSPLPEIFGLEINGMDKCPLCGRKLEEEFQTASRISGGEESSAIKWPWHAAIYHITPSSFNYRCGGSMIQSNAVLTAAHCVTESGKKLHEQTLQVGLGETEMMVDSGFRSGVFKSIVHQNYDHFIAENDIALLILENQIKYSMTVLPICLPTKGVALDGTGMIVGFGSTEVDVDGSLFLMEAEIPIATNEECFDSDVDFFEVFLDADKFCVGQEGKLKNICEGDTGGGFYMKQKGLWLLKGVSSETSRSGSGINPTCSEFAIFTEVVRHLDWISDTLNTI